LTRGGQSCGRSLVSRRSTRVQAPPQGGGARQRRQILTGCEFSPPADEALPLDHGLFSRYIYFRFFFPFCSRPQTARRNLGMQHRSLFPVIITPALAAARDFYVQYLGFHAVFDSDWHVQLRAMRADGGVPLELAFMSPDLVSQPFPLRSAFNGQGML